MRLPLKLILFLVTFGILADVYICRIVSRRCNSRTAGRVTVWSSVLMNVAIILVALWPKRTGADNAIETLMWALYAYLSVYIAKYVFILFDLAASVPKLFRRKRLRFLTFAGIGAATAVFALMWWGALINRFRIDVRHVEYADKALPAAFDGYRIVHISDIHSGTYGTDTTFLSAVVDSINALSPDVVLFTGDIVNRRSAELMPFTTVLSRIKAPVYSVLGNHDYGDYYNWPDDSAKRADVRRLCRMQAGMGWHMLNNATDMLRRDSDSIALVGVENIGDPPFRTYGSLEAAYPGDINDGIYKILMSHNPAHWVDSIAGKPGKYIPLTLSGHTHAMQTEIAGRSPAAWVYPTWGGMYHSDDDISSLYVNIGLGTVGIPARIGATPEITLITLRRP